METTRIAISSWGSISALGIDQAQIWQRYLDNRHYFQKSNFEFGKEWTAPLSEEAEAFVAEIRVEKLKYRQLDPSVWYAIAASRIAVKNAGWNNDTAFGINIGSSRGATTAFERYHRQFVNSGNLSVDLLSSPTTTLGNIASWTASDLGSGGPVISHSITCSTALHAIINAVVWIKSGFAKKFLAGGSEAPLTPFTLAQMKALKVYSDQQGEYPCLSMQPDKTHNTMILGEGAASFCLEAESDHAVAQIIGIGFGTEIIEHGASLSSDGICLQKSMKMAIGSHDPGSIDLIVTHCPGTVKGDLSEIKAIREVFGNRTPLLTSNKWKIGHTFGASGALSLEMAILMLRHDQVIQPPYLPPLHSGKTLQRILINSVGFGGNAASILIEK